MTPFQYSISMKVWPALNLPKTNLTCFFLVVLLLNLSIVQITLGKTVIIDSTPPLRDFNKRTYKFHIKNMPRHLANDLKHTVWGSQGLIFLLASGASMGFHPYDDDIKKKIDHKKVFGGDFDNIWGDIISPYTIGGASLLGLIIAGAADKPKLALAMESALESWALTMAITGGLKFTINRQRPNGGRYSFPSGHTSAAFSMATVLTRFYGIKAAIPSYLLASLTGFTRIDNSKHFLTDVLVGAVLGTAIGWGTSSFHKKEHPNYLITPMITNHGSGLVFNKTF